VLQLDRRSAAKTLARWAAQGWLVRLRRGLYGPTTLDSTGEEAPLEQPWVLVPELFEPAYVGGWSAAEHWDLTEQIFREVCVFTARSVRRKRTLAGGAAYVLNQIQPAQVYGTSSIWHGRTRIQVSDRHRTILDLLWRPAVGGGIRHVASCLQEYLRGPDSDLEMVIAYADRLGVGAVFKRLGFLLERSGDAETGVINACLDRLSAGNAKLDPALRCHKLVKRWRLWVSVGWMGDT